MCSNFIHNSAMFARTTRKDTSSADLQLSNQPSIHTSTRPHIHSSVYPAVRDVIHRVCGNVEITVGCTYDQSRELRMPVGLLDFLLSLVDEEQLRRDLRFVLSPVGLRCVNIQKCKFVVLKGPLGPNAREIGR